MITLLADFTNGFPASPFAGSVASAVQLDNAVAVPGTRKAETSIAAETTGYARFRIFPPFFTVSLEPQSGRTFGVGRPPGWHAVERSRSTIISSFRAARGNSWRSV